MQNEAAGGEEEKCHTRCVRFTGIRHRKWGKWGAEIRLCRSRSKIWLGSFDTQQEAALAYDAALYCLRGPNARFNFPESRSRISSSLSSFASAAFSCMSTDDIKNFCRNYALQHRMSAEAELPTQQQQDQFSHEHRQVSSSAAAAVAASVDDDAVGNLPELSQLWDLDENVAWFQREMQLGILMQQPLHHYEQNTMIQGDEMEVESWAATVWSG